MPAIEIANPQPGGSTHTSRSRAAHLIATGQAAMLVSGRLLLLDPVQAREGRDHVETEFAGISIVDSWTFPHTVWVPVGEEPGA